MKIKFVRRLMPVVFLLLLAWQSGLAKRFVVESIAPTEVKARLEAGTATLVDVRENDETAAGMIRGALAIPLSGLQEDTPESRAALGRLDRSKLVMLYCRSGNRSAKAALILETKGFQVRNAGGYEALVAAGLPTQR